MLRSAGRLGAQGAGRPAGCSASADRGPGPRSWTDSALRHHVSRRGFVTQASGDQALNVGAVTRLDEPAEPSAISDRGVWESTQPGTPARTWSRRSLGRAWRGASVLQGGGMRAAGPSGTPVWGRPAPSRAEQRPLAPCGVGASWALAADLAFVPGASRRAPGLRAARRVETSACSLLIAERVRWQQVPLKLCPRLEFAVAPAPFGGTWSPGSSRWWPGPVHGAKVS